jgi:long-chain acyl-CoA synthetase
MATDDLARGLLSGSRGMSAAEFDDAVLRAASGFAAAGVGQGDCVAILMRNDFPFLVASLAAVRLGAYAVPLNWHFAPDEIAYVLADCRPKVLVAHTDLLGPLDRAVLAGITVVAVAVPAEVRAAYAPAASQAATASHQVADWQEWLRRQLPYSGPAMPPTQSMIYTSGTTGRPKGVRRLPPTPEQQKGIDEARRMVNGLDPGVRALMPGPLYHSAPNSFALRAVRVADCLVLMPRFDAEQCLALIERHRITTTFMVPTMFVRLMKLPEATRRRYDISSLRYVIHAGAPCPPDIKRAMIAWWGPIIWEYYGATEIGAVTIISSPEWLQKPGSVGRATPGATLSIQDEAGRELPPNTVGEVFARLSYYPDFTYHNQPEKRAEVGRGDLVTCGDMGYLDTDGYLFLCDRKRDMVISGGVNIYPAEIESVAVSMPGVKDCAVFGVPDAEMGETLLAVVEPVPGAALTPEAIRAFLRERLAGYKVPREIEIRTGLPREDSGKIFKRRLRDPYWAKAGRHI